MKKILVTLLAMVALPTMNAFAWAMHYEMASRMFNKLPCLNNSGFNATDAVWPDTAASHDGVGYVYYDEEYTCGWSTNGLGDTAHAYFPSWPQGCAPTNANGFVPQYYTSGYRISRGLHFLQDMGQPLHTYNQISCQGWHGSYESWVASNFTSGQNFSAYFDFGMADQISSNNPSKYTNRATLAQNLAAISRSYFGYIFTPYCWSYSDASRIYYTKMAIYYTGRYSAAYVQNTYPCP